MHNSSPPHYKRGEVEMRYKIVYPTSQVYVHNHGSGFFASIVVYPLSPRKHGSKAIAGESY